MDINKMCPGCMREIEGKDGMATCPNCGYDLVNYEMEPHQMRPFTILAGKYVVGKVIGEGGFGILYLGYDLNLELAVAIKEFYPNGFVTRESNVTAMVSMYAGKNEADVSRWRDGFISEARSLAKFSNLNGIVEVRDFFYENGTAYIVMEYIDGITLKHYLKQNNGRIPVDKTFQMMEPVISSLSKVHEEGLIHRDISPDNIMITKSGDMKLLDFGAAREYAGNAEKSLSIMLKPGYAPEEQYRSRGNQGPWTDVYALAATIYKCITGVTPVESMERVRDDSVRWPREMGVNLTDAQEAAIRQGMAVYAEERFQSMGEFYSALYMGNMGHMTKLTEFKPSDKQTQRQKERTITRQGTPPAGNPDNRIKIILIAAIAAFGLIMMIILGVAVMSKIGSGKGSQQASNNSQTKPADSEPEEESTAASADKPEKKQDASDEVSAQVDEISDSVSSGSSMEELGGALDKFLELAEAYGNEGGLGEQVYKIYGFYQGKALERINACNGQEPSAPLYMQISSDLNNSLGYVQKFQDYGIGVNAEELEKVNDDIQRGYKNRLVSVFDECAERAIKNNTVVSRSELWSKMTGIIDTDLYDKENPADPLRLRYAAALTLNTDSELDKLGGDTSGKIKKIYDVIADTDYSPYMVYMLKQLGDPEAADWYNYYCNYNADDVSMEGVSDNDLRNGVYYYYTKKEWEPLREGFRQYMSGKLK